MPIGFSVVLDTDACTDEDIGVSSTAVQRLIAPASELTEEERSVLVDAIAPEESVASLADEWEPEIATRVARVRSGPSRGKPAGEVFDRLESKLEAR